MMRKLAPLFEVIGVLALGWTLTRIFLALLRIPDLLVLMEGFIAGGGNDFTPLLGPAFATLAIQFACLMVPALLIGRFVGRTGLKDMGIATRGRVSLGESIETGVALFLVAGIAMKALLVANLRLDLGSAPSYWAIFEKDWNAGFWVFMAIGSFAVIPVFEEIFYRGYAHTRASSALGFTGALFVAGLFALSHFQYLIADVFNVWMLASLFLLAIAMAAARHFTGSVIAPIVIHALMNIPLHGYWNHAALAAMVIAAFFMRVRIAALLRALAVELRRVSPTDLAMSFALVAGFVAGMALQPQATLLACAALLLLSLIYQLVSRRPTAAP